MRKALLKTGEKAISVMKWQRIWLDFILFCEIRYLVKQILSSIERTDSHSEMLEERGGSKKKLWSKNEPEFEDMGNSQPVHIAENEKAYSAENT